MFTHNVQLRLAAFLFVIPELLIKNSCSTMEYDGRCIPFLLSYEALGKHYLY